MKRGLGGLERLRVMVDLGGAQGGKDRVGVLGSRVRARWFRWRARWTLSLATTWGN